MLGPHSASHSLGNKHTHVHIHELYKHMSCTSTKRGGWLNSEQDITVRQYGTHMTEMLTIVV